MGALFRAERPLQVVVIDHVKVNAILVGEDAEPLGRPWLTIAVDAFTRVATGFHLALSPPSRISVSMCLLQSICGKKRWLTERGVEGIWPVAGVPESLRLDPQSFYGLRDFGRVCANMDIRAISNSASERRYGAHIEALIGSRMGDVFFIADQGLMRPETFDWDAPIVTHYKTLPDLERHIARQIIQRYHFQRHRSLGRAPIEVWRERENSIALRAPGNCLKYRLSFMPEDDCLLEEEGVRLGGRIYSSKKLKRHFDAGAKRVMVKYDPRDWSSVFVQTPAGRYVRVYQRESVEENEADFLAAPNEESPSVVWERAAPPFERRGALPERNRLEMAVAKATRPRGGCKNNSEAAFAIDSVELIERRCASSCPFAANPRAGEIEIAVQGC